MTLTHRYKAWFILEAETPMSIGSGRESITVDRLVIRNAAGFPYIPGTALAGVLRHTLEPLLDAAVLKSIFGFSEKSGGVGSQIIVNSAHLLADDGHTVLEGIPAIETTNEYYQALNNLPVRDYVSLNERGTALDAGKFDAQLLYKGVRFVTSMELASSAKDKDNWALIVRQLNNPAFRIGGGTRKGYGKLKLVKIAHKEFDLTIPYDVKDYMNADNSLQLPVDVKWLDPAESTEFPVGYTAYSLRIKAKDFFLFGAGYGDDEADASYKTEKYFEWSRGKPKLVEQPYILIPASSIKGALRHRVAYHYNSAFEVYADQSIQGLKKWGTELIQNMDVEIKWDQFTAGSIAELEEMKKTIENLDFEAVNPIVADNKPNKENLAVKSLFGYSNDSEKGNQNGQRGNVLLEDIFVAPANPENEKVFDHVKIDRYTGGASDGALFQEKTISHKKELVLKWLVKNEALQDEKVKEAWHKTLDDLCNAALPLGGRTTKGHGLFVGEYKIEVN